MPHKARKEAKAALAEWEVLSSRLARTVRHSGDGAILALRLCAFRSVTVSELILDDSDVSSFGIVLFIFCLTLDLRDVETKDESSWSCSYNKRGQHFSTRDINRSPIDCGRRFLAEREIVPFPVW